jgi:RNA methyltransferase, TrmH family
VISKNTLKQYSQLQQIKYRKLHNLFVAEGKKTISDLLIAGYDCEKILCSDDATDSVFGGLANQLLVNVPAATIKKISSFKNPQPIIGIFHIPQRLFQPSDLDKGLHILLDDIQDPGNLGAIIRVANWFGVKSIICSPNSVDAYNPKVVQASMGAFSKVHVHYMPIDEIIGHSKAEVYGTFLEGKSIYECELQQDAFIVFGNEGKGISSHIEPLVSQKLHIPSFGKGTDSLNLAVATGIVCAEFRRGNYSK